ncbi:NnrS family protein [Pseudomonas sp. HK3]
MNFKLSLLPSKPIQAALWDLAFRPFFIIASALSIVSLGAWLLILNGHLNWQSEMPATLWHIHEMLFGFALTIAAGFLMTAVQTWTNLRSLHGYSLMALVIIWLVIRVLLIQDTVNLFMLMLLQTIWWGMVIVKLAQLLLKANSQRNYKILPLLCVIASLHLFFLYCAFTHNTEMALHIARSVILFFSIIISLISGRVIPMFTRNGINRDGDPRAKKWAAKSIIATPKLDKNLLLISLFGASVFFINGLSANTSWSFEALLSINPVGILMLIGLMHLYRLSHWAPQATLKLPLLWSLHAAYLFLGLGLIAMGASAYTDAIRFADAVHLITVGTLGGMILAMICRVSLGHTGRALVINRLIAAAFFMIIVATLLRFLLPLLNQHLMGWNISALLWVSAFSLFLYRYTPMLMQSKI